MFIDFERAVEEDADEIKRILSKAFEESYRRFEFCPAYNTEKSAVQKFIKRQIVFKILNGQKAIGAVFLNNNASDYHLNTLCIIPEYQNRGIGTMALEFIESQFPEANAWFLETPMLDIRNCNFYKKNGYLKIGEYKVNQCLTLNKYKKQMKI